MGTFGEAFAVHVYAQREIRPFRLDLGFTMGADVGEGVDAPKGKATNHGDKENGRGYDHVPRCFHGFTKPIYMAGGKCNCRT